MFGDFKVLICLLDKNEATYLVIGAYAVSRHSHPETPKTSIF